MPSATRPEGLKISIDRGGTFTDCICKVPGGDDVVIKILSVDSANYNDAPTEAVRQVLEKTTNTTIPRGTLLDLSSIEWIRMGTTVATNALLERKGAKTALLVSEGLKDILTIGDQSRPDLFQLNIKRPGTLLQAVHEVSERIVVDSCPDSQLRNQVYEHPQPLDTVSVGGEKIRILERPNLAEIEQMLLTLRDQGITSLAICLMHAYIFPDHELQIADLARSIGFEQICVSHQVSPRPKIVSRGNSTVVDAYLTPAINAYLSAFLQGFPDIRQSGVRLDFMQSDGGLVPSDNLSGLRSILSGPAGGVVGYARTCYDESTQVPLVGLDMGGTSTDVSRYAGALDHTFESVTAGVKIQTPQVNVRTIAAGGGSILSWRDGMMCVGPESASSDPGPACYRKGGPLTITDANLALGRLLPERFPAIFGPDENQPLDAEVVEAKFRALAETISQETGKNLSWTETAAGFLQVANNAMSGPIRALTEACGHRVTDHYLASFGGAGGQHACDLAEVLGIKRVLIHKHASILSAYGIGLADVVEDKQVAYLKRHHFDLLPQLQQDLDDLVDQTQATLAMQGLAGRIESHRFVSMRYDGSDTTLMMPVLSIESVRDEFVRKHHEEFGFTPTGRDVYIDEIRVRSIGKTQDDQPPSWNEELTRATKKGPRNTAPKPVSWSRVGFIGVTSDAHTPVYTLDSLRSGDRLAGPCLIVNNVQTIVVTPQSTATMLTDLLVIDVEPQTTKSTSADTIDPVQLSVFRHRFYGVAEQAGLVLQKVSVSANIKERLDFSCAVFSASGHLVANAPHVPAMIGSMAFAVRSQMDVWKGKLRPGDVLLSNSPVFGGVHLPDMTVISPVFDDRGEEIIFWAASRGHHADVGGIAPGSMPPTSEELWQEGAVFESFLLVRDGEIDEAGLEKTLLHDPSRLPGCSGSRCYSDNVTDLKAQVASNQSSIRLIHGLIAEYTLPVVHLYMQGIQDASAQAVSRMFRQLAGDTPYKTLSAVDYMDDGTPIQLSIHIDSAAGTAIFDFTGTGKEVLGNWNAPRAICTSAIIYALRCLVDSDIPLNHGCIRPVDIILPEGSLLHPSPSAAVCAGNVLTSQRIVDVILRAFEACAASQGCMNNFTFGIDGEGGFGYYETICGGSGAGPTWHGTSGVHTHMTNTRITDPESLERRYPVILRRFGLREGSGGRGRFQGGDGVIREVEFRTAVTASMLSERRSLEPYGLDGGQPGQRGVNIWKRGDGREINMGGKRSVGVKAGDRAVIHTPGGGGYGESS